MNNENKSLPFDSESWGRETIKFKRNVIRERIDPLDFYVHQLDRVLTRKPGWTDAGLCPFHVGNIIGSFHVDLNSGAFKCLSCGAEGCDVVDFTAVLSSLSSVEALEKLTYKWSCNISLNGPRPWGEEGCHATH